MEIRMASAMEMLTLWGYKDADSASTTAQFFYRNICAGNAIFWTIDNGGQLIGELYAFLNLPTDKDCADGEYRAYLCAFRVQSAYRGKGLGAKLMEMVLDDLRCRGFVYATIGVDEAKNEQMYRSMGFTRVLKTCYIDPCAMTADMRPAPVKAGYKLLAKTL